VTAQFFSAKDYGFRLWVTFFFFKSHNKTWI
jgi:hypothetical protein